MSKLRKANKASAAQLMRSIVSQQLLNGILFHFIVTTSLELVDQDRADVWDIFEKNMYKFYRNSSFGWDPPTKQKELYNLLSRFILVRSPCHKYCEIGGVQERGPIVAFVMFRFERENKENIIYCYEIQVSDSVRRHGLGKILMQQIADIGAAWGMQKVMLTVFKANVNALKFYEALSFTADSASPHNSEDETEWRDEDEVDCDYEMLYKIIENLDE